MVPTAVGLNAKALPSVLQVIRLTHRICTAAIGGPRRATSDADQPGDGRRVEDRSGPRHADAGSHAWCPQSPPKRAATALGAAFSAARLVRSSLQIATSCPLTARSRASVRLAASSQSRSAIFVLSSVRRTTLAQLIPTAPPVTIAALSARRFIFLNL